MLGDVRLVGDLLACDRGLSGQAATLRARATAPSTWTSVPSARCLKRFKQWRRLEDDVKMLTESGGEPIGRC